MAYGRDIKVIECKPRWKWFKPPMWRIFRWAYKITKEMVFINCVPVGCSSDLDVSTQPIEFMVMPPPEFIMEIADSEIRRAYNTWMKGLTEE